MKLLIEKSKGLTKCTAWSISSVVTPALIIPAAISKTSLASWKISTFKKKWNNLYSTLALIYDLWKISQIKSLDIILDAIFKSQRHLKVCKNKCI